MAGRSLRASAEGIQKLRKAIKLNGWKQDELKEELGLRTRQPITRLLAGEPIERSTFEELCHLLGQPIEEIALPESEVANLTTDIDALVQAIREQIKPIIQEKYGTMRVLDMEHPIELTGDQGIYTNVNILERLSARRRLEIAELLENCGIEEFDRFGLTRITEKRVPGLEAVCRYNKLMVLGKPGAGKTTFLKYLAMQCIEGNFLPDHVPIFITLRYFAEADGQPGLFDYLDRLIPNLPTIVQAGRALILLDGLDEVREEDTDRILRQIRDFSDHFFTNQFVITCRIAAKDYTFERFTEVEVADFDKEQIATFANNWFRAKNDSVKGDRFLQKLEENEPIQELASSPLLLTLLCLMFGESADFPSNRAELYKEGLDVLLKKWDAKRNIERDQVYKNLSLKRKEDLLSQIALTTFEQKDYFFKQKAVEGYIADFIRNLPDATNDLEILQLDSEAILKSVEAQHGLLVERAKGIYSFSHLTFQEYFAAREINSTSSYNKLVKHITKKQWREIFLLTVEMIRQGDSLLLLMKQEIDKLIVSDEALLDFFWWLKNQSVSEKLREIDQSIVYLFHLALNRVAFTFRITVNKSKDDSFAAATAKFIYLKPELELDITDSINELLEKYPDTNISLDFNLGIGKHEEFSLDGKEISFFVYENSFGKVTNLYLADNLRKLFAKVPESSSRDRKEFQNWWQLEGESWVEQIESLLNEHRKTGHNWQFCDEQERLLQQYYDATKLLVDCLNSDCYVSREVRQEIEETLLLPIEAIREREKKKEGRE